MPEDLLQAVMDTLPVEFSIVDENDNVVAWNKHSTRISPTSCRWKDRRGCLTEKSGRDY